MTGRSRLQHLPSGTLSRHQPDPLTLLVLLNLHLKPICLLSAYITYHSASEFACDYGAIEICTDIDIDIDTDNGTSRPLITQMGGRRAAY